ncbi:hypothetical protein AJ79_06786 [Helicocarpus griseus UAMH5409]|uniref:Ornithine aminotransferase n=1 Tax=Helicocarpus griseus UAMH5409 TaxID=1447875 RepID=A0A2B7X9A1_9EURO|nr:hypothetical protein AJ79_06786 [Helicocarpus griseus UAMH5409]
MAPSAIPLTTTMAVPTLSKKSAHAVQLWQEKVRGGFAPFPVAIERAKDYKLYDVDGKEYIDMVSQFAVMNFGYSNTKIVDATIAQIKKSPLINTGLLTPLYGEFADCITKVSLFPVDTTMRLKPPRLIVK